MTVHYCEYDLRNYTELLERADYEYDNMIKIVNDNETVDSAVCSTLIAETSEGFTLDHEVTFFFLFFNKFYS